VGEKDAFDQAATEAHAEAEMIRPSHTDDEIVQWVRSVGSANGMSFEADGPDVAGVLWIPDPEQRRSWREKYVYRETQRPDRPLGFRKP